ncbi:unnamed protein product [Nezara viridula]|uniref:Uncharacterized protein n=1 Tax=Nezara viridula TaxID=85310 RepID=A0A9P0ED88_NEZVI|nr:unnamed protein product [Nezara viridula]
MSYSGPHMASLKRSVRFPPDLLVDGSTVMGMESVEALKRFDANHNIKDNTIPGSRLNPVSSSSTSYRAIGNNPSQNMTTTPLAIENVQDTASAHESIEKNENALRNEGQMDTHDESFHQVAGNANENQSRNAPNSSIIVVNTNDENVQPENPNNADEMIVAALAFVLECCDMCVIL